MDSKALNTIAMSAIPSMLKPASAGKTGLKLRLQRRQPMIPKRCKRCKYKGTLDGITCQRADVPMEIEVKICDAKAEAEQDLREKIIVNFGEEE